MKDSIFIKALYYGKDNPNGFTKKDLEEYLGKKESDWGPLKKEFEAQRPELAFNQAKFDDEGRKLYWLTKSGYRLLSEIDDVSQAKALARNARVVSWVSILITVAGIFLQAAGII